MSADGGHPGKHYFFDNLASPKAQRVDVEVVRLRNETCHGNILSFVETTKGTACSPRTAADLLGVAFTRSKVPRTIDRRRPSRPALSSWPERADPTRKSSHAASLGGRRRRRPVSGVRRVGPVRPAPPRAASGASETTTVGSFEAARPYPPVLAPTLRCRGQAERPRPSTRGDTRARSRS